MNIRTAHPETDIPGIAAVVNAFESPPVTLEIVQEWFTQTAPGRIVQRKVAVNSQEEVIGTPDTVYEIASLTKLFSVCAP